MLHLLESFDESVMATASSADISTTTVREEYTFFTLIKNKRDERIKRGLLTRGMSIASKSNNVLHYLSTLKESHGPIIN